MQFAEDIQEIACPRCIQALVLSPSREARCMACGWTGKAMAFRPVSLRVDEGAAAMPDDAVCVHHPAKRAVAVCSGTGAFICDLCLVEVDGTPYSTQYLDTVGKHVASRAFDRYLPRPDSLALFYTLLSIPGCCSSFAGPLWAILGFMQITKAGRLRQSDALYAHAIGPVRLVVIGVLLGLFSLLDVFMVISMLMGVAGGH